MFRLLTMAPGALIVAFGLYEVFQDLFHPTRTGSLSDSVSRAIFVLFRRRKSLLPFAGPLALVLVILCWVFLLAAGFALIYWSSCPAAFDSTQAPILSNKADSFPPSIFRWKL